MVAEGGVGVVRIFLERRRARVVSQISMHLVNYLARDFIVAFACVAQAQVRLLGNQGKLLFL